MKAFQLFKHQNTHFWHHWWQYGKVVLTIELLIGLICVPVLNLLANTILNLGRVKYVSYTNLGQLLKQQPWVILALLVILGLILALVFTQFTLLLLGFYHVRHRQTVTFGTEMKMAVSQIRQLPISAIGFFSLYFLIILPFSQIGFTSQLLSKVKIPRFILDWLISEHPMLAGLVAILYLLILYLGLRWLFVLPLMILEQQPIRQAMRLSWAKTAHRSWGYARYIMTVGLAVLIVVGLSFGGLLAIQSGLDHYWHAGALSGAIINLSLTQVISVLASIYGTSMIALLMLSEVEQQSPNFAIANRGHYRLKQGLWVGFFVITGFLFVGYSVLYFQGFLAQQPMTISHRGVDNGNGVQNSISALQRTAREKPDYVEMDVQETKDHQFVVLHDENLKHLAGIDQSPSDLTLAQLQKITVHENGYSAKIVSFDDYYRAARQAHQKLLIEFKKTPAMTKGFVKRFATQYGSTIRKNGDLVHSLDYTLIQQSRRDMPRVGASYILSFNLVGVPKTPANYFTMEYTTLNDTFIDNVHAQHKKVLAWTVNDADDMDQLMLKNVDGIITDQLGTLNTEIKANFKPNTYTMRLLNYMIDMPASQI